MITCAAPAYLLRHGQPESPTELNKLRCLHFLAEGRVLPWSFRIADKSVSVVNSADCKWTMPKRLKWPPCPDLALRNYRAISWRMICVQAHCNRFWPILQNPLNPFALFIRANGTCLPKSAFLSMNLRAYGLQSVGTCLVSKRRSASARAVNRSVMNARKAWTRGLRCLRLWYSRYKGSPGGW